MYMRNTIFLHSEIPSRMRPVLSVKLRQVRGIVSAVVEEKKVTVYYVGQLDLRALNLFIRAFEEKYGRKKEQKDDDMDVATYRREAIISVGGFIAMNILRKVNPEFYGSILLFRRLFTLYIARRYIKNGIMGLVKDHQANADTLTATAVAASVLAGKPESSLTLLALSNGAEMMTEYAAEKARRQISGLLKLDQRDVWLVENGHERKVPVESLKRGDLIAVHLGEKICVDGSVVSGNAAVNQASITGESNPAIKQEKLPVYAGSVIEAGDLVIRVEKVGADTSLAQIIHLVEEAQTRRAPVQNFADKMANLLVPISFIGAAIVYGATKDWQRVLNLLFIDFSCGLKLSTATAISAAIGVAARKGILIKGGNYIENLADIDTVVLDKTGTITMGVPQIDHIETVEGVDDKEMILLAASAEMHSVHRPQRRISRLLGHPGPGPSGYEEDPEPHAPPGHRRSRHAHRRLEGRRRRSRPRHGYRLVSCRNPAGRQGQLRYEDAEAGQRHDGRRRHQRRTGPGLCRHRRQPRRQQDGHRR